MSIDLRANYQLFSALDRPISPVTMGTATWGRNEALKNYGVSGRELPSDKNIESLVARCLELGINVFDTAPAYGLSEKRLGAVLSSQRKNIVICTKTGEFFEGGRSHYDFSEEATRTSVQKSLSDLKTDYLDVVTVHLNSQNDFDTLKSSPVLEALCRMKEEGKIRAIGASTHSNEATAYAVEHLDLVMANYNVGWQVELDNIKRAQEKGVFVMIKKGLNQGHLDKIGSDNPIKTCMKAVTDLGEGVSLVMGTTKLKHLNENIETYLACLAPSGSQ